MASITLSGEARARLRSFGRPRMSDAQIVTALLDRVDRDTFVGALRDQYQAVRRTDYVDLDEL